MVAGMHVEKQADEFRKQVKITSDLIIQQYHCVLHQIFIFRSQVAIIVI